MKEILIADDHSIVRIGTTMLIKEVIGSNSNIDEAATFDQALIKLKEKHYDLILLDINIPGGNNLDMINAIKIRNNKVKILVFSSYDENIYAVRYIQAGANGYLWKESGEEEFKKAINTILSGTIYLSDAIKEQKVADFLNNKPDQNALQSLSNREIEVANLMVKGLSTTEISQTLHIRLNTVSTYKAHIFSKLGVHNLVELIEKMKLLNYF